jgi:uncharacterized protein
MRNYKAKNVDQYIASSPREAQYKLEEVRTAIKSSVPKATEEISWGIPFYKYHGVLAGFASFGDHVSFGFADAIQSNYRKILENKGYAIGKKTIQIKFDQKVPDAIIEKILKEKTEMNTKREKQLSGKQKK